MFDMITTATVWTIQKFTGRIGVVTRLFLFDGRPRHVKISIKNSPCSEDCAKPSARKSWGFAGVKTRTALSPKKRLYDKGGCFGEWRRPLLT